MSIKFYSELPWSPATELHPVDRYTGDGTTTTFTLAFKNVVNLASTVQAEAVQYYQYTNGLTRTSNGFTLSSPPPASANIVAPGINALVMSAFDQDNVVGVVAPRVQEVEFWIADIDTINVFSYTNMPQFNGIEISFMDMIPNAGASLTWVQLACADPTTGLAMTYAATGQAIYTTPINTFGTVASGSAIGVNYVFCNQASAFAVGDYVVVNFGGGTAEIRHISSINTGSSPPKIVFDTNLEYAHSTGETIFTCGRKFWARLTVPLNATNNIAANDYSIALRKRGRILSKI